MVLTNMKMLTFVTHEKLNMRMVLWNWHWLLMRNHNHENGLVKLKFVTHEKWSCEILSHKYVMCLWWKFWGKQVYKFSHASWENMRYTHIRIELLPWQWKITSFLMHREKIWDIRIVLLPWQRSKYLMNLYEIWYYFSPNYYVRFMSEMHLSHIHDTHVHEYISFASCLCTTHIIIQQKTYT